MIKVNALKYRYRGQDQETLRGLNFAVKAGEIFGFLGPSGAGKSTTQKVLIGLLKQYQGQAAVLGKELSQWDRSLYQAIGVAFESPNLIGALSAEENLRFFCELAQGDQGAISPLLEKVGLWADKDKRVSAFSKGMKMRLGVIRAWLHNPQILFLDEPTSGLDPASAVAVKVLIKEAKKANKAIFLTTHNMDLADELCDELAFLNDGEIAAQDSPKNLKKAHGRSEVEVTVSEGAQTFPLEGLGQNQAFSQFLQEQEILTIHSKEARMEEVFLKVTGRKLC
jgi:fluoroquinolone transport system ATP-binding protein